MPYGHRDNRLDTGYFHRMSCAIFGARFLLPVSGVVFVVAGCTGDGSAASAHTIVSSDGGHSDAARLSNADRDARVTDKSHDDNTADSSLQTDVASDAGAVSPLAFCNLTTDAARFVSEWSCGVKLTHPVQSSPIYDAIRNLEGGIVSGHDGCDSSPLAWYPDDPTSPTKMIACESACALAGTLFPGFVASIRPLSGCDDPGSLGFICTLPEEQYRSISEAACVVPIAPPDELEAVRRAIGLRGETVGSSAAICDSDPLAWYPNDPSAPTKLIACDAACTLSMNHFPVFVAAIKPFLGCDEAAN
jgi:hypothetical protein